MTKRSPSLFAKKPQRGHPGGPTPSDTTFAQWVAAMGFNKKQVSEAGKLIGLSTVLAVRRNGGDQLRLIELLAMSAVRATYPPWSQSFEAAMAKRGVAVPKWSPPARSEKFSATEHAALSAILTGLLPWSPSIDVAMIKAGLAASVSDKLPEATPREIRALALHRKGKAFKDIGKAMGVTRERARQLVKAAILAENQVRPSSKTK